MRHVMRFCVLASGSRGNACYVETEDTRILVDAGLSGREIERRLDRVGVAPATLDALIITHEHIDHIRGAGPFSRRFDLPLYTNRKTLERGKKTFGNLPRPVAIETEDPLTIKTLNVETFTKCHDAADPVGVVLSCHGGSPALGGAGIGFVTDLGRTTRLIEDRLKGCRALIMEFNYDRKMLDEGPYPLDLKRRIKGQDGHLSNQQAGDLLRDVFHRNLKYVVLAHLSETNNTPEKARQKAKDALKECDFDVKNILISRQDEPGEMIKL